MNGSQLWLRAAAACGTRSSVYWSVGRPTGIGEFSLWHQLAARRVTLRDLCAAARRGPRGGRAKEPGGLAAVRLWWPVRRFLWPFEHLMGSTVIVAVSARERRILESERANAT